MRYTYHGNKVYFLWPISFQEGFDDGLFALPKHDLSNLYRYPVWKKISWRLGWLLGRLARRVMVKALLAIQDKEDAK